MILLFLDNAFFTFQGKVACDIFFKFHLSRIILLSDVYFILIKNLLRYD